jgi:uncharacterized membrane protein
MTYDPKTDPSVRDACVCLGVFIETLPEGSDRQQAAATVERTAMEIAERAVRAALRAHNIEKEAPPQGEAMTPCRSCHKRKPCRRGVCRACRDAIVLGLMHDVRAPAAKYVYAAAVRSTEATEARIARTLAKYPHLKR